MGVEKKRMTIKAKALKKNGEMVPKTYSQEYITLNKLFIKKKFNNFSVYTGLDDVVLNLFLGHAPLPFPL